MPRYQDNSLDNMDTSEHLKALERTVRSLISTSMRYVTAPCPMCGADIRDQFAAYLGGRPTLPGESGGYRCPECDEMIRFQLAKQSTVEVMPYMAESEKQK